MHWWSSPWPPLTQCFEPNPRAAEVSQESDAQMPKRDKPAKKRPPFLIADANQMSCKECGATMDYPFYQVPMFDFLLDACKFFELHEHCDTQKGSSQSYPNVVQVPQRAAGVRCAAADSALRKTA
jgi:hypothetical protein